MGKYTEMKKRQDLVMCNLWIVVGVLLTDQKILPATTALPVTQLR